MENEGTNLDVVALNNFGQSVEKDLIRLTENIIKMAGVDSISILPDNWENSFDKLKISAKAKKTKSGQYATSEDVLLKHRKDHAIVESI